MNGRNLKFITSSFQILKFKANCLDILVVNLNLTIFKFKQSSIKIVIDQNFDF